MATTDSPTASLGRCPVCGMAVTDRDPAAAHLGVSYRFCCPQCVENFTAHPRLYVGKGAPKAEGKRVVKRRTFALDSPLAPADANALKAALQRMMGIRDVDIAGARIAVGYDLLEATAEQIERGIEQAGAALGQGWAARIKRGWAQYTEDNELENLSANDAPCCNRPPHA